MAILQTASVTPRYSICTVLLSCTVHCQCHTALQYLYSFAVLHCTLPVSHRATVFVQFCCPALYTATTGGDGVWHTILGTDKNLFLVWKKKFLAGNTNKHNQIIKKNSKSCKETHLQKKNGTNRSIK